MCMKYIYTSEHGYLRQVLVKCKRMGWIASGWRLESHIYMEENMALGAKQGGRYRENHSTKSNLRITGFGHR